MAGSAFVLGGGGVLGAAEAGMAGALLEAGVVPDLICGTSIGAINGAALAADPTPDGAQQLVAMWGELAADGVLGGSLLGRLVEIVRSGTSLHDGEDLRRLLLERLPVHTFEELLVPFQCVAASIERAREHWFSCGDLIDAVLASCALPGVFPPVCIAGEHFFDGGLVNSIPLARAVQAGADTVWVLHVGRVEEALTAPRFPWEVGFVASRSRGGTGSIPTSTMCPMASPFTCYRRAFRSGRRRRGRTCATATVGGSNGAYNSPTRPPATTWRR
jgi:NTE family protein